MILQGTFKGIGGLAASPYYPVDSDCVLYHAYWDGTALDHSSHGNDGTVHGPTFGPTGLVFDGTFMYVTITPANSIQLRASDFAYFYWLNLTTGGFIHWMDTGAALTDIIVVTSDRTSIIGQVGNDHYYTPTSYSGSALNSWHLIGYEIDRNGGALISVDGIPVDTLKGTIYTNSMTDSVHFYIGSNPVEESPITGIIGETLWFNTYGSYSGMTRLQLYNATKGRYGL